MIKSALLTPGFFLLIIFHHSVSAQENSLTASPSVACPSDNSMTFTCTLDGGEIHWIINPPPGITLTAAGTVGPVIQSLSLGSSGFEFRAVFVGVSNGKATSTLTTVTSLTTLRGSMVHCQVTARGSAGPIPITLAAVPSSPRNLVVSSTQQFCVSSLLTLTWSPPSSTSDVSVMYTLTISPPPPSGSPVTVETTSTQITVSYNTQYTLTLRATNCAGTGPARVLSIPSTVVCPYNPSTANRVTLNDIPSLPALPETNLLFTCNGATVSAVCLNNGQWSPNPSTYQCLPPNSLVPADCTVPEEPSGGSIVGVVNGVIVNYERLNETVEETAVLTYQCDSGFSLTGPNIITCTNTGIWSTDPTEILCVLVTTTAPTTATTTGTMMVATESESVTTVGEVPTLSAQPTLSAEPLSTGVTVAITGIITFIVSVIIGFAAGFGVSTLCYHKKSVGSQKSEGPYSVGPTTPAGPVYEEVSLKKEKIELSTNNAYGQVGM